MLNNESLFKKMCCRAGNQRSSAFHDERSQSRLLSRYVADVVSASKIRVCAANVRNVRIAAHQPQRKNPAFLAGFFVAYALALA